MFCLISRRFVVILCTLLTACDRPAVSTEPMPGPSSTTSLFPPLDGPSPDCTTHPHLCGLPLVDLGGGEHPRAFQLVFIGDGFVNLDDFVSVVDQFHVGLVRDQYGPVPFDPALFHFWRVDLQSESVMTMNDERRDTPLGAGLLPPDSCVNFPFITADHARVQLALSEATLGDDSVDGTPLKGKLDFVHAIVVVADSIGRANADSTVRMSSFDSVDTLRHELGHALFALADEYAEFDSCPPATHVLAAQASDGDLVVRPNVQRSKHPAKWFGTSSVSVIGGERVPCLHHPTEDCIMAGTSDAFCQVCSHAIDERLDLQRCGTDDQEPPRVAIDTIVDSPDFVILPGGSRALVRAVVDDTRDGGLPVAWVLDGEVIDDGSMVELDLAELNHVAQRSGHALPDATLIARAVDRQGNIGESRPLLLDEALPGVLEVRATNTGGLPGLLRLRVESVRPHDLVEVTSTLETVVIDAGPEGIATMFIRVPLEAHVNVDVVVRSSDGRLLSPSKRFEFLGWPEATTTSLPPTEVVLEGGSTPTQLAERSLLQLAVRSCVAVLDVGVMVDDEPIRFERVPARDAQACRDGQALATMRFPVDVDGAQSRVRPVIRDVAGREIVGDVLQVVPLEALPDQCLKVTVNRAVTSFDPMNIIVAPLDGGSIFEATGFIDEMLVPLRIASAGRGLRGSVYPVDLKGYPVDLKGDMRLRIAVLLQCPGGAIARVRRDIDINTLMPSVVDLSPPVIFAPLHAPRGNELNDVLLFDDNEFAHLTVDDVPIMVEGSRARLQVRPGARIHVVDAVGLESSAVVGESLRGPRVPSCD